MRDVPQARRTGWRSVKMRPWVSAEEELQEAEWVAGLRQSMPDHLVRLGTEEREVFDKAQGCVVTQVYVWGELVERYEDLGVELIDITGFSDPEPRFMEGRHKRRPLSLTGSALNASKHSRPLPQTARPSRI